MNSNYGFSSLPISDQLKLSADDIVLLWRNYLSERKGEKVPEQFDDILSHLLNTMDQQGMYMGTLRYMSAHTKYSSYVLRNNMDLLAKHKLIFRRAGIVILNTNAFNPIQIEDAVKEFFE